MNVRGLFDYYSGAIPRAPRMIRSLGMEWAWRLAQEPARLARRYLVENFGFLARAARYAASERISQLTTYDRCKRALDVFGATLGLMALSPLFLICAVAIRLKSSSKTIFTQTQVVKNGRTFAIYKFR